MAPVAGRGRRFLGLALVPLLVAVASVATVGLGPGLVSVPFGLYYVAVVTAARYSGILAGVATILLALLPAGYFFAGAGTLASVGGSWLAADGLFAVVAGLTVLLVHDLRVQERRRQEGERRLSWVLESAMSGVILIGRDRKIVSFNAAAETMLRCGRADAIGRSAERFFPERFRRGFEQRLMRLGGDGEVADDAAEAVPTSALRADGEEFPIEAAFSRYESGSGESMFVAVLEDITRQKATEHELTRLNRLHSALGHINQAIVLSPDRDELFRRACRIMVEAGGFRMAWIGWHDPEGQRILPVAVHGDVDGYLDSVQVTTDGSPLGGGPSGVAFRERRPYICDDMLHDPGLWPWAEQIRQRNLRASAAFPLRLAGEVVGMLTVYAAEPRFFGSPEINLLDEAAADISFAIDNFRLEEDRRRAQSIARREQDFSDAMIESMPGVLYFYDDAGKFLRWNKNFENVTAYSSAEVAGMSPRDFFTDTDLPLVEARIMETFTTGHSSVEASFRRKDGTTLPYFFTGRRIEFDGRTCLVGVGIDITERKNAEAALRELNENLERKVGERTAQLADALSQAESADRLKSAFLATMSHELRTPLNSILGFTGIILQGLAGPLTPEQQKQLGMVRGSARHLLELINDVLDISKIEAGELEIRPRPFNVLDSIDRVAASVRPLATARGLALAVRTLPGPCEIGSDRRRVEQVLLNLLNNAIKFTERGGVVFSAAREEASLVFRVEDTGIGIKPEDLGKLFQPFRQIDSGLARQHEGTGLGLAICRRLAAMLGGTIEVESRWRHGSIFTFRLPIDGGSDGHGQDRPADRG